MKQDKKKQKPDQIYFVVQDANSFRVLKDGFTFAFAGVYQETYGRAQGFCASSNLTTIQDGAAIVKELRRLADELEQKMVNEKGEEAVERARKAYFKPTVEISAKEGE